MNDDDYSEQIQKINSEHVKEQEQIIFQLSKYCEKNRICFEEGVSFVMTQLGYTKNKGYYFPNPEEISVITQKSLQYMRKYGLRPESYIQSLMNGYSRVCHSGYVIDIAQKTFGDL